MNDAIAFELFDKDIGPGGKAEILENALGVMSRTWEGKTHTGNEFLESRFLTRTVVNAILQKLHPQAGVELNNFAFVVNALMGVEDMDDMSQPDNLFQAAFKEWLGSVREMSKPSQ